MRNCLITKLQGAAKATSLEKYGEIRVPISAGNHIQFKNTNMFRHLATIDIELVSGSVTFTKDGTTATLPYEEIVKTTMNVLKITAITDSVISLRSKYDIISVSTVQDWDVNTRVFEFSPITYATLGEMTKMHGDIKYIYKSGNVNTTITLGNGSGGTFTGELSTFGDCLSLTTLQIRYNNGVSGTIESLVQRWVANGRTTGTCSITCNATTVKFNGSFTSAGNNKSLSWQPNATEGRTDITFDGTTITIDNATGNVVS